VKRAVVALSVIGMLVACTAQQRQFARDVLSVISVACIIANQELPEEKVKQVCGIAEALVPAMQDVLAKSRAASAKAASEAVSKAKLDRCAVDAGH